MTFILLVAETKEGRGFTSKLIEEGDFIDSDGPEDFFIPGRVSNIQNKGRFEISGKDKEAYMNESLLASSYEEEK